MEEIQYITPRAGGKRFQIGLSELEIGLLIDLLNSVSDFRAAPLRQTIEDIIRSNTIFDLLIDKKIVQCDFCKGSGAVRIFEDFLGEYLSYPCPKCKATGRRIRFTCIRFEPLTPLWQQKLAPEL